MMKFPREYLLAVLRCVPGNLVRVKGSLKHRAHQGRIRGYGNQMKGLLSRHEVRNIDDLKQLARDSTFKVDVPALWDGVLKAEGGKITLTIVLSTIANAMGGVRIRGVPMGLSGGFFSSLAGAAS